MGIQNILIAVHSHSAHTRVFFASSSLVYGNPLISPQNEMVCMNPISPYGVAKAAGSHLVRIYRESHGIFACSGILYNHESPRRDSRFLPKKIVEAAIRIKKGLQKELKLGDLDAVRDWGFAGDFVEAMWLMLQQERPVDYVIGTGIPYTVRDILNIVFEALELDWQKYVVVDNLLVRPKEKFPLVADPKKARIELGWVAHTQLDDLIAMMIEHDMKTITI